MTGNAFLSQIGSLSKYRSKFASDPIDLTHHIRDPVSAKEHSRRLFLHQSSIAVFEKSKEVGNDLQHICKSLHHDLSKSHTLISFDRARRYQLRLPLRNA